MKDTEKPSSMSPLEPTAKPTERHPYMKPSTGQRVGVGLAEEWADRSAHSSHVDFNSDPLPLDEVFC